MRAMRKRASLGLPLLFVVAACADNPPPVSPGPSAETAGPGTPSASSASTSTGTASTAPAPVTLTTDTPESTAAGATFTAPAGWSIAVDGPRALMTGPESDLHVAVIDSDASNPDDAVSAAWSAVYPQFKHPLRLAQPRPGRRGWDEQRDYDYETSPNEKIVVFAAARRHGTAWTVTLVASGQASFEKRLAQARRIGDSLRPKGYVRETFAGKKPNHLDADRIKKITDSVDKARDLAGIPGVGLALVQDGKVVYEGGLGVRETGKPEKVDAKTLFIIASNTKAMTTLLLAKLVDEKKLTWDTPVTSLYPSFKLGDADTTRQVLVKHLICACTGLPRQDFEWLLQFETQTPKSELELLGTMQPTTKFGETFQYSNPLAAAAGFIGGYVVDPKKELGAGYDAAMQSRVFGPLGMTDTTFDFKRALAGDRAIGHDDDIDGKTAVAVMDLNRSVIPVRPAGGEWSSVHDVSKYVMMELANGKLPDGKRYISEDALLARRKPQVPIGEFATYGMGLMVDNEWGVPVVHHGGDIIGYHSDMFWIPDANVGGIILTNGPGYLIRRAFMRKTAEVLFDGNAEADDDAAAAIAEFKAGIAVERKRLTSPPDADVAAKLAKRYTNAALGDIVVSGEGAQRTFDFGGWKSPMASRKNDDGTVSMVTIAPGATGVEFVVADRDGKRALVVRDMQHEYVFAEAQ
jgi:CubicO group peptidase (beta-lactamase class C family)